VPGGARRRLVSVAAALLLPCGCSALVSLDGLSNGAEDGGGAPEAGGPRPSSTIDGALDGVSTDDGPGAADAPLGQDVAPTQDAASGEDAVDAGDAIDGTDAHTSHPDTGTDAPADTGHDAHDAHGDEPTAPADAALAPCVGDLSNVGTGDFVISLSLETTQPDSATVALLNQRSACSPSTFWDLRLYNGKLLFEIDDSTNLSQLTTTGPDIDDGATHSVVVARAAGTVVITVDGTNEGSTSATESLGALPALADGTDVCDGNDGTVAFSQGKISNVCVGGP
jgi:hypothetical protein